MMLSGSKSVLALLLAPVLFMQIAGAEDASPEPELPDAWSQFVREAVDGGLLTPPDQPEPEVPVPAEPEAPVAVESVEIDEEEGVADAAGPISILEAPQNCSNEPPFNFFAFGNLARYQDLYQLSDADDVGKARAFIALGMYSEAETSLRGAADDKSRAQRALARLMANRTSVDVETFRALASCHETARFWYGLALLLDGRDDAPAMLNSRMYDYLSIPKRLRADVASLAIPALEERGERELARKLLEGFSEDERKDYSQLRFVEAVVRLGDGEADAEPVVREYLTHPRFQEEALEALDRTEAKIETGHNDVVLQDMMRFAESVGDDVDLSASLDFALSEYEAASRYDSMMDLGTMPVFQGRAAQSEIRGVMIDALERDLGGEDPLRRLAGLSVLAQMPDILSEESDAQLFARAVMVSAEFGFGSLAAMLTERAIIEAETDTQRAAIALRHRDYPTVYTLATRHSGHEEINLLATLAAMREGDDFYFQVFADRLVPEPESIVRLVEEDAMADRWIIPDYLYLAAENISDEVLRARIDRVLTLRLAAENNPPLAPVERPIESAAGTLERISLALRGEEEGEG